MWNPSNAQLLEADKGIGTECDDYDEHNGVPAQYAHLLEEGMSEFEIAQLAIEMETVMQLAMMAGNLPEYVRVLIDGGTFRHMFSKGHTCSLIVGRCHRSLSALQGGLRG